jgi:hypothetical protein
MRILSGFSIAVALVSIPQLFGQQAGFVNPQPVLRGGVGSVVWPGGTWATVPGITRNTPSVVNPGGGGVSLVVPFSVTDPTFPARLARTVANQNFNRFPAFSGNWGFGNKGSGNWGRGGGGRNGTAILPYPIPVYVGGGYSDAFNGGAPYGVPPDAAGPPPQQQPNVIIVYPQQQPAAQNPAYVAMPPEPQAAYQAPPTQPAQQPVSTLEPSHYLIAFKDHTIYSAVAYWVDGDTLHYFTNGNTHNQVSLALVDRPLTERLNRESGIQIKLPAAK